MKTYAQENLQFSGYPLKIVDDLPATTNENKPSKVIKLKEQQHGLINTTVNDPLMWDAAWFSNYE